jgi:hypothetical protein
VLAVERYALLADPAYVPTCSLNPVLNCGSIMASSQAEAFGFPNPLLGVAGAPVRAAPRHRVVGRRNGVVALLVSDVRSWLLGRLSDEVLSIPRDAEARLINFAQTARSPKATRPWGSCCVSPTRGSG